MNDQLQDALDAVGWADGVPPSVFKMLKALTETVQAQQSEIAALKSALEQAGRSVTVVQEADTMQDCVGLKLGSIG